MQKLLVALDGSKPSIRAFQYAAARAKGRTDVAIHVIYAQPRVLPTRQVSEDMIKHWQTDGRKKALSGKRVRELRKRTNAQVHVETGDPATKILDFARAQRMDEIVMGTRGMGRLKGLVMGSVATKVAHLSPVPVVLVK